MSRRSSTRDAACPSSFVIQTRWKHAQRHLRRAKFYLANGKWRAAANRIAMAMELMSGGPRPKGSSLLVE